MASEKHTRFGSDDSSRMEDRRRVLTVKYGKQQLQSTRNRVKVENWVDQEVTNLFDGNDNHNVDIDVELLLKIKEVGERRRYAYAQLQQNHCPASMDKITVFLDELNDKIKQL